MEPITKELKAKMEDYKRFIMTLIILSFYFYIGSLINLYIEPKDGGPLLMLLSGVSITAALVFIMKWKKCNKVVQENQS